MFIGKGIDEVGDVDNCFISYIFVFLIALFEDFPLLLSISNRTSILNLSVADAICRNSYNDGLLSTRDRNE